MIVINLDVMMAKRKMSLTELADRLGMTMANVSNFKNHKAKAFRFSTLDALRALDHAAHRKRENSRDNADENEHENRQIIKPHELIYSEHRAEHRLVD